MDKVIYSVEDVKFLLKWRDEHKDLVRQSDCPLRAVKIIIKESGIILTCVRSGITVGISITRGGKSLGRIEYMILPIGMYKLTKNTTKGMSEDDIQSVVSAYASTMALIIYGGDYEVEKPKRILQSSSAKKSSSKPRKSKSGGITYLLRRSGNEARVMRQGKHRSPSGTFTVRGHFRHYQNGKVIWIEEFSKGRGKHKDKIYKI